MRKFNKALLSCTLLLFLSFNASAEPSRGPAIIMIGGSLASGDLPLNDQGVGVIGGLSMGRGSYLSLGHALIKDPRLPGYVINEAQAGATTFTRAHCPLGGPCIPDLWRGFDEQLDRALARVSFPGSTVYNAKFVVITGGNDCLHSNAFGIPQEETTPCNIDEINAYVDRLIAFGQRVLNLGMTPIFENNLPIDSIVLVPRPTQLWMMNKEQRREFNDLRIQRIRAELPGSVLLDIWDDNYEHFDGLHPTNKTASKAAAIIAKYILDNS